MVEIKEKNFRWGALTPIAGERDYQDKDLGSGNPEPCTPATEIPSHPSKARSARVTQVRWQVEGETLFAPSAGVILIGFSNPRGELVLLFGWEKAQPNIPIKWRQLFML